MRSLFSVALWTCVFLLRQNVANAVECKRMSIQFGIENLHWLTNCTSILGSLTLHSIDDFRGNTEISKFQFPKLKEITGYLLIYNVKGLTSVGQFFPNLVVIRGRQLVLGFALIIFSNPNLTKVDLKSLVSIQRGYVLIEKCPALCYHNTIDWEAITDEDEDVSMAGKVNIIQAAAPQCPTKESCRACHNERCWSSFACQKTNEYFNNLTTGVTCHDVCLGGCVNGTTSGCHVCTKLTVNGTCVDECPSDLFIFRDTMRCITRETCIKAHHQIPFRGECRSKCPASYSSYHPVTKALHISECFECAVKCVTRCRGRKVQSPADLEHLRDCTVVDGGLYVTIDSTMAHINEKLEENLGNIETINGVLTIYRSFTLTSLSFFRSLTKIDVQNATSTLKGNDELSDEYIRPYGLEIYENDNLQTLFNWKEKQHFEIIGGGMFIHYNSKLCMSEVHNLQSITDYDRSHDSLGYNTNGYDETCHATGMYAFDIVSSPSDVQIYWNISDFGSNRRLIGYFVYYIEAPSQNISYFSGLDACSTKKVRQAKETDLPMISKKNHGEVWQSVFVPLNELKMVKGYYIKNVTNLKQYTQYAYYVRTQLSLKIKDQLVNVTQGQSPVKYFRTQADRPRPPIVRTKQKTNDSITLEWIPSTPDIELVERYFIDVYAMTNDVNNFDDRDYCLHPKVKSDDNEMVTTKPEVICCSDQRAYLEFFKRGPTQNCGDWDASCEKTFKFVLFHHHVENVLLNVDLAKDPSERHSTYSNKREYFEAPPHHKKGKTEPIIRKNESDSTKYYLHSHIIDDKYMDSVVVPNLKPFHLYIFHVYACNKVANCSDYYFYSDRTKPSPRTDDARIVNIQDETTITSFDTLTFVTNPPFEPSPQIVAYEIETQYPVERANGIKCITKKEMESMSYTFRIGNLTEGLHWFRIRTLSVGSNGLFCEWLAVMIDHPQTPSTLTIPQGLAIAVGFIAAIIVSFLIYRKVKNHRNRRDSDGEHLFAEGSADADEQRTTQEGEEGYEMQRISSHPATTNYFKNMTSQLDDTKEWNIGIPAPCDLLSRTALKELIEPVHFQQLVESPPRNQLKDHPLLSGRALVTEIVGQWDQLMAQSLSSQSSLIEDPLVESSPPKSVKSVKPPSDNDSDYDYSLFD